MQAHNSKVLKIKGTIKIQIIYPTIRRLLIPNSIILDAITVILKITKIIIKI